MKTLLFVIAATTAVAPAHADMFIQNSFVDRVIRYNEVTGANEGVFVNPGNNLLSPTGITFGPDGNLYLTSTLGPNSQGSILKYNGQTGAFMGSFATAPGYNAPRGLRFGPDGNLYAVEHDGQVYRYNGTTGAFIDVFASLGGVPGFIDLTFGADGNLYVSDDENNAVQKFNGANGTYLGAFTSGASMNKPKGVRFGPDNNLYVSDTYNNRVLRFDGSTGAFMNVFASGNGLNLPQGIEFRPDGLLYVVGLDPSVRRFDDSTGAFFDAFVTDPANLTQPQFMAFSPTAVPEPATILLLGCTCLGGLGLRLRRRRTTNGLPSV